ncbi:MAG: TonB-dependent receptor [Myxococcales bacterium]|nr:TonB-dependent receptor [Myxococcales bacterium]
MRERASGLRRTATRRWIGILTLFGSILCANVQAQEEPQDEAQDGDSAVPGTSEGGQEQEAESNAPASEPPSDTETPRSASDVDPETAPAHATQPPPVEPEDPGASAGAPVVEASSSAAPDAASPSLPREQPEAAPPAPTGPVEEIVITGSRIRRSGTFPASAPVQVLDSKQLAMSGAKSLGDLMQTLTSAPGSGVQGMGSITTSGRVGTSAANLRGLGFGATLVLLNGRRIVKSAGGVAGGDFSDLSTIPLDAVRRVEVLKGGASAVYGADAVAGVINVITHKDWTGVRAHLNTDSADDFDYRGYNVGATLAAHNERGGVLLAADWDLHTELRSNARDWTWNGGHFVGAGFPGTFLVAPGPGDPPGPPGPRPDPNCTAGPNSSILEMEGTFGPVQLCGFSDRDFLSLLPATQRGNVFASGEYKLTEHTRAFGEAMFSRMLADAVQWPFMVLPAFSVTVPADHVDNVWGRAVPYSGRVAGESPFRASYKSSTFHVVAGLRGDLEDAAAFSMFEDWEWELYTTYGLATYTSKIPENLRPDLQRALYSCSDPADLSSCFNPFYSSVLGTGTPNAAPVLAQIQTEHSTARLSGMRTQNAAISGTLFDLPGGPLGIALGGQIRQEWATSNANHDAETSRLALVIGATDYSVSREVYAGFLELRLPVYQGIEMQAAGRLERHTDISQTSANPTVGVTVSPARLVGEDRVVDAFQRMTLRGHVAKAFRAPSMVQSADVQTVLPTQINIPGDPAPLWLPVEISGNPEVKNETALAWSAGLEWTIIDEISLLAEFWSFQYQDRIESEDPTGKLLQWRERNEAAGGCVAMDPSVVVDELAGCIPTQVKVQTFNVDGDVTTSGLDLGVTFKLTGETFGGSANDFGAIRLGVDGVYTLSYKIPRSSVVSSVVEQGMVECDGTSDSASCEVVGNRNATNYVPPMPVLRANFPLSWLFDGHAASLVVHHVGPVDDDKDVSVTIDAMTTIDLQYGYTIEDWIGHSLTLRVGAINLLDQDPPVVASDQLGFDPEIHDPRGRMLYAKLTGEF